MNAMRARLPSVGEPLGRWTPAHTLGAGVVVLIALSIGGTIWPGWARILAGLGA